MPSLFPRPALPEWDTLGFSFVPTDSIWLAEGNVRTDPVWGAGGLRPFAPVEISPAAAIFSYGQGIFEGLKVRRAGDGRVLAFRLPAHAARFERSAQRLLMAPFPQERFIHAVEELVRANSRFVPPAGKGSLYVRPLQHAIEPKLGHGISERLRVLMFASPVGSFFNAQRAAAGLRLRAVRRSRAAVGGTGAVKSIGNYAGGLAVGAEWRAQGFDDVVYLDARRLADVTETGGANVFVRLRDGTLATPPTDDQILAGVTRDSVICIARDMLGWPVVERPIPLVEILADALEVFCTGTAWTVRSVAELVADEGSRAFPPREACDAVLAPLQAIQRGSAPDPAGWIHEIEGVG
jgi:branched-chain amino acid aminotransferase